MGTSAFFSLLLEGLSRCLLSDNQHVDREAHNFDVLVLKDGHQTRVDVAGSKRVVGSIIKWSGDSQLAGQHTPHASQQGTSFFSQQPVQKVKFVNGFIVDNVKTLAANTGLPCSSSDMEAASLSSRQAVLPSFIRLLSRLLANHETKASARAVLGEKGAMGEALIGLWDRFLEAFSHLFLTEMASPPSPSYCLEFYKKLFRLQKRMLEPSFVAQDTRQMVLTMLESLGSEADPSLVCESTSLPLLLDLVLTLSSSSCRARGTQRDPWCYCPSPLSLQSSCCRHSCSCLPHQQPSAYVKER